MAVRACCCVKPRTGAILVGAIDLLIGLATAIGIVIFLLGHFETLESSHHGGGRIPANTVSERLQVNTEKDSGTAAAAEYRRWNSVISLYAFTAFCAALHGILLLIGAGKKQSFFTGAAIVVNVVMILGCANGTVALFFLGYHWIDLTLMPFFIGIQIYFLWADYDFQKYLRY